MTKKERAKLRRQRKIRRTVTTIALMVLTAVLAIGGTIAWLTDETDPLENTFTAGDINISLEEGNDLDLKMVPGKILTKDPEVTVEAGSEACWLFVKVEESDNFVTFMTYTIADGWTKLTDVDGVYYREVAAMAADAEYPVLKDDEVTVKESVTKEQLNALTENTYPTLTFTAYACQQANVETVTDAWAKVAPSETPATAE